MSRTSARSELIYVASWPKSADPDRATTSTRRYLVAITSEILPDLMTVFHVVPVAKRITERKHKRETIARGRGRYRVRWCCTRILNGQARVHRSCDSSARTCTARNRNQLVHHTSKSGPRASRRHIYTALLMADVDELISEGCSRTLKCSVLQLLQIVKTPNQACM